MNQLKDLLEADQIQYSEEIFETSDNILTLERNLFVSSQDLCIKMLVSR